MNAPDKPVKSLFLRALELPPEERDVFVASACGDDEKLRNQVLHLLRSHETSEDFLQPLTAEDLQAATGSAISPIASEEKPGDQFDRYRLIERIGEGAWGTVWRAQQTVGLKREVALKILKLGLDTKEFLGRFETERQALALMDHPNIGRVLDAGANDYGRPYFVMELVPGLPLDEFCDRHRLTIEQRLDLFIQICEGVQHAHKKGIIHRDLKPSNILVVMRDDDLMMAKIIDFGVAKTTQVRLTDKTLYTGLHSYIGTPAYSSPEQLEFSGSNVDYRSDLYSLGALLYQLVCGRAPYPFEKLAGNDIEGMRKMIRGTEPRLASRRFSDLPVEDQSAIAQSRGTVPTKLKSRLKGDLERVINKCLEKDRSRRYESATALASDLKACLKGSAVSAAAPSPVYRIKKFITRKRPAYAVWLELTAVTLTILLVFSLFYQHSTTPASTSPRHSFPNKEEFSIAVLPFENRSGDEEDITEGLNQTLYNQLGRIQHFRVISQTTVKNWMDEQTPLQVLADQMGIDVVVEGNARKSGDQFLVNIQLVDARSDSMVWGESYTREFTAENLFLVQMQIATDMVKALETRLSPEEQQDLEQLPSQNYAALEAYWQSANMDLESREDRAENALKRLALLERAVKLDPEFALAWSKLGELYWAAYEHLGLSEEEGMTKAESSIRQALKLDPRLSDAWTTLGWMNFGEDREKAKEAGLRAVALNTSDHRAWHFMGIIYLFEGNVQKAFEHFEEAMTLGREGESGMVARMLINLGRLSEARAMGQINNRWDYELAGQFDESIRAARQEYHDDPDFVHFYPVPQNISNSYKNLQLNEEAANWLQIAIKHDPECASFYRILLLAWKNRLEEADDLFWKEITPDTRWVFQLLWETMLADHKAGRTEEPRNRYYHIYPEYFEKEVKLSDKPADWMTAQDVAMTLHAHGETEQARHLINQVIEKTKTLENPYPFQPLLARALALRGDREAALQVLRETPVFHPRWMDIYNSSEFASLRGDPDFEAVFEAPLQRLRRQRERVLEWEKNGELAEIPQLPGEAGSGDFNTPDSTVTIAVLPFENRSNGEQNVSEGLYQILHNQLTGIKNFRVISQRIVLDSMNASDPAKDLIDKTKVDVLISGNVMINGDQLMVSIQLEDADTYTTLWGDSYLRDYSSEDLFLVQMQMATDISRALEIQLSPEDQRELDTLPTQNKEALDAYTQAINLDLQDSETTAENVRKAAALLERAVKLDPDFAWAWQRLGYVYDSDVFGLTPQERRGKVEYALRRALEIDPGLSEASVALAWMFFQLNDFEEARAAADKAIEQNTGAADAWHFVGMSYMWENNPEKALEYFKEANSLGFRNESGIARMLMALGRFDEALALNTRLDVRDYFIMGQFDETIRVGRRDYLREPDEPYPHAFFQIPAYHTLHLEKQAILWAQRYADHFPSNWNARATVLTLEGHLQEADALFWNEIAPESKATPRVESRLGHLLELMLIADHQAGRHQEPRDRYQRCYPEFFSKDAVLSENLKEWELAQNIALAQHANGEKEQATRLINQVIEKARSLKDPYPVQPLLAQAQMLCGNKTEALQIIKAMPATHWRFRNVYDRPEFASLRGDPKFEALFEEPLRLWQEQRNRVIRWEENGDLAEMPPLPQSNVSDSAELDDPHPKISLAVLPFANPSNFEEDAYFADGIHKYLLGQLSRLDALRVTARSSVMRYRDTDMFMREIGEELDTEWIVAGDVQRGRDEIQINIELIDADSNSLVWSDTYTRTLTPEDIFQIQMQIVASVTNELQIELSLEDKAELQDLPTNNMEAMQAYWKGMEIVESNVQSRRDQAISLLKEAVELDPQYAEAWIGLVRAYMNNIPANQWTPEYQAEISALIDAALNRALELDDSLAETYFLKGHRESDPERKKAAYKRALELNPSFAQAYVRLATLAEAESERGDLSAKEETLQWLQFAHKLDPNNHHIRQGLALQLLGLERYEEARRELEETLRISPEYIWTYFVLASLAQNLEGRHDEAIKLIRKVVDLDPVNFLYHHWLFITYANLGDHDETVHWCKVARDFTNPDWRDDYQTLLDYFVHKGKNEEEWIDRYRQMVSDNRWWPTRQDLLSIDLRAGRVKLALKRYQEFYPCLFEEEIEPIGECKHGVFRKSRDWDQVKAMMEVAEILVKMENQERANDLLDIAWDWLRIMPRMGFEALDPKGYGIRDAHIHALKGEKRNALDALREAFDAGFRDRFEFESSALDSLREDAEFIALMEEFETEMARQLESVRRMEANGELEDIPDEIRKVMEKTSVEKNE